MNKPTTPIPCPAATHIVHSALSLQPARGTESVTLRIAPLPPLLSLSFAVPPHTLVIPTFRCFSLPPLYCRVEKKLMYGREQERRTVCIACLPLLLLLELRPSLALAHEEVDGDRLDVFGGGALLQHVLQEVVQQLPELRVRTQVLLVLETSALLHTEQHKEQSQVPGASSAHASQLPELHDGA